MPFYNTFAGVDAQRNFPPVVRSAIADSSEIAEVIDKQVYAFRGNWNANTNSPSLSDASPPNNNVFYVVTQDGTVNFGSGAIDFDRGDYVFWDGNSWARVPGATGDDSPWHIDIFPMTRPSEQGTWVLNVDGSCIGNGFRYTTTQDDYLEYTVLFGAGVWECSGTFVTTNAGGILTVKVQGQEVAQLDTYSSSTNANTRLADFDYFTVARTGMKTVRVYTTTKNPSSAAYWCYMQSLNLRRIS